MQGIHLVETLKDVPYDELYEAGVRRLLFDYDGTLVRHYKHLPSREVLKLLAELNERFEILIFSNNWIMRRSRKRFFDEHNIPYYRTQKPFVFEYAQLREPKMTVLIGDKLLTDGLYALLRHIPCYLLKKRLFGWR